MAAFTAPFSLRGAPSLLQVTSSHPAGQAVSLRQAAAPSEAGLADGPSGARGAPRGVAGAVAAGIAACGIRRQARTVRGRRATAPRGRTKRFAEPERNLGLSQRVEDDEDEEPLTHVLDFKNAEERLENVASYVRTPITLLSGFLGAGKTSLLKHMLENQEGVRVGVVVNDVASVNIDAQLVQKYEKGGAIEIAELSNGCICCTASDDLVASVQDLVNRAGSSPFHHIIIELSGVGEPEAIRRHWDIGVEVGMPATLSTEIKRTIAVVDASLFGNDWLDSRKANARNEAGVDHQSFETVGQLLAEQVEKADVVLMNKTDMATDEELQTTDQVVKALNPEAKVIRTTHGEVSPLEILPEIPHKLKYPEFGKGLNYRWAQAEDALQLRVKVPAGTKAKDIDFSIGRNWMQICVRGEAVPRLQGKLSGKLKAIDEWLWELDGEGDDRHLAVYLDKMELGMWEDIWEKPAAGAPPTDHEPQSPEAAAHGHEQEHGHEQGHGHDKGHGHEKGHDHGEEHGHGDAHGHEQKDQGHSHGHGHEHHGHDHSHDDGHGHSTTAETRFGIHTFTYMQRRPFSAHRLKRLFEAWPLPEENKRTFTLADLTPGSSDGADGVEAKDRLCAALRPVLRSKGFCWIDSDPLKMQEWAHAGRSLTLEPKDWWWSVLTDSQLHFQVSYPGAKGIYDRARKEKWDDESGDRRQELVFIGGPEMSQEKIGPVLDACLLDDAEYEAYRARTDSMSPPATFFGVEGLLRQMGEDPADYGRGPGSGAEAFDTELADRVDEDFVEVEAAVPPSGDA